MDTYAQERIIALRAAGHSYADIARLLALPLGSVKSFCSRNELKKKAEDVPKPIEKPGICRQCGAAVTQLSHRKVKLFCSDACRIKWWNAQRSRKKNKKYRRTQHDNGAV